VGSESAFHHQDSFIELFASCSILERTLTKVRELLAPSAA
jgi:hypothetical protein